MTGTTDKTTIQISPPGTAAPTAKLASVARRGIIALALAGAMSMVANSASAEKISDLRAGAWKGGAYSNNNTGEFSHCAASARYKSGTSLLFSVTRSGKWSMAFADQRWSVEPGSEYEVAYRVDNGQVMRGKARVRRGGVVQVFLPPKSAIFQHFRNGEMLHVATGSKVLRFNLTDTSKMLKKLLKCAAYYRKAGVSNPFAPTRASRSSNNNPFSKPSVGFKPNTYREVKEY